MNARDYLSKPIKLLITIVVTVLLTLLVGCQKKSVAEEISDFSADFVCLVKDYQEKNADLTPEEAEENNQNFLDEADDLARSHDYDDYEQALQMARNYLQGLEMQPDEASDDNQTQATQPESPLSSEEQIKRLDELNDLTRQKAKDRCKASDQFLNDLNF